MTAAPSLPIVRQCPDGFQSITTAYRATESDLIVKQFFGMLKTGDFKPEDLIIVKLWKDNIYIACRSTALPAHRRVVRRETVSGTIGLLPAMEKHGLIDAFKAYATRDVDNDTALQWLREKLSGVPGVRFPAARKTFQNVRRQLGCPAKWGGNKSTSKKSN